MKHTVKLRFLKLAGPIIAVRFRWAARRDERRGFPLTAAMEWRRAAELCKPIALFSRSLLAGMGTTHGTAAPLGRRDRSRVHRAACARRGVRKHSSALLHWTERCDQTMRMGILNRANLCAVGDGWLHRTNIDTYRSGNVGGCSRSLSRARNNRALTLGTLSPSISAQWIRDDSARVWPHIELGSKRRNSGAKLLFRKSTRFGTSAVLVSKKATNGRHERTRTQGGRNKYVGVELSTMQRGFGGQTKNPAKARESQH
jgi:hypothetical protein